MIWRLFWHQPSRLPVSDQGRTREKPLHNNKSDEYCNKVETLTNYVWVKVDQFGPMLYQGRTHAKTRSEQRRGPLSDIVPREQFMDHNEWLMNQGSWIMDTLCCTSCRPWIVCHGLFIADLGASNSNHRLWTLDPGCRIYGHGTRIVVHR